MSHSTGPAAHPTVPLIPLDPYDPAIRESFQARWIRRPLYEQMTSLISLPFYSVKKGYELLRRATQSLVRPLVYHASSSSFVRKMDGTRLENSRQRLREIGGQTVLIRAEDGNLMEGMYFDVENFRRAIVERGGQFLVRDDGKYVLRSYDPDLTKLLRESFDLEGQEVSYPEMLGFEYAFEIELDYDARFSPTGHEKRAAILTQGNAGLFEMDRADVVKTLLSGQSCMVFNLRGTGRSHGTPNEARSYQDIEAVCQFLNAKGFPDSKITVHGYCLGSGMAVDLASRRRVDLVLDRTFAKIGDVMADTVKDQADEYFEALPGISKRLLNLFIESVVPRGANWLVMSYDNASKIKHVRGSIL